MAAESAAVRRLDRGARLSGLVPTEGFAYSTLDRARMLDEAPKRGGYAQGRPDERSPFARDRARILHSYAFRRLADKTQVVSPGQDDFPRTRLTHSLEVAQIARELGAALGCDPDLVDAAGLAHDLGHPPFGHNGERALDECARSIGGFEGNAQTLRILTRLEAREVTDDGRPAGLNLSRATLDAVCKYPWPSAGAGGKFGVYADDTDAFAWFRDGEPDGRRCLEAQVMDWSDDVAYSVHDVEDGVHSGHIRLVEISDDDRAELCQDAAANYSTRTAEDLAPVLDGLLRLPALMDLACYDGSLVAQAVAKRATSELTGRFVGAAIEHTRAVYGTSALGRYTADLQIPEPVADECALLKAMAMRWVMRRDGIAPILTGQRALLTGLVERLVEIGEAALSPMSREQWRAAGDDAARLRVVIDQVAQLTDSSAREWHRSLTG